MLCWNREHGLPAAYYRFQRLRQLDLHRCHRFTERSVTELAELILTPCPKCPILLKRKIMALPRFYCDNVSKACPWLGSIPLHLLFRSPRPGRVQSPVIYRAVLAQGEGGQRSSGHFGHVTKSLDFDRLPDHRFVPVGYRFGLRSNLIDQIIPQPHTSPFLSIAI